MECISFADGTVGQGSGEIDLGELLSKVGLTLDVERSTENEKIYSFMSGKVTAEVTYTLNGTDIGHYVVILNNEVIYESNESNEEPQ